MVRLQRLILGAVLVLLTFPLADGSIHFCYKPFDDSRRCLSNAIYFEARGEPIEGQRAVLDVINNRAVQSGLSVCEVVKAKAQFSWYNGTMEPLNDSLKKLLANVKRQGQVLEKSYKWFYSGPKPYWAKDMECRKIANATFCKEKSERQD